MQSECDTALLAVLFTVAVAGVVQVVDVAGVERNEAETMCDELISKN